MPTSALRIRFTAIRADAKFKPGSQVVTQLDNYAATFMAQMILRLQDYPPEPAGSGYVRTEKLKDSWGLRRLNRRGGIGYEVFNTARDSGTNYYIRASREVAGQVRSYNRSRGRYYARWVQGPQQTGEHAATGWRTTGAELERLGGRGRFRDGVQKILTDATSQFGGRR